MKIKIGQKVYLQKYDVSYIMHELNFVQAGIVDEIFKDGKPFIMNGAVDGYTFDCVFEDPSNVKWLMNQDWIVDYDQYKDKTPAEIIALYEELVKQGNIEAKEFNAKDPEYRKKHFLECRERLNNLEHKLNSLEAMAEHLNKKIKFAFPKQMDEHSVTLKNVKKPGFFARVFGRSTR